ncbi:hypothetical protein Tco_0979133 [Tanacetum coccineum]
MANLLPRLKELETATKSTMMADQVLVLMEKEIDKELKFEEKFRNLCSEMADTVKNRAEYIEELESDMEKAACLQIMMDQSHLGVREMLISVQKLKDGMTR